MSTHIYILVKELEQAARRAGMLQNDARAPWNAYDQYTQGTPEAFVQLLQWALTEANPRIARAVCEQGFLLHRARFSKYLVVDIFKAVDKLFGITNPVTVGQFCSAGYVSSKLRYATQILRQCTERRRTISPSTSDNKRKYEKIQSQSERECAITRTRSKQTSNSVLRGSKRESGQKKKEVKQSICTPSEDGPIGSTCFQHGEYAIGMGASHQADENLASVPRTYYGTRDQISDALNQTVNIDPDLMAALQYVASISDRSVSDAISGLSTIQRRPWDQQCASKDKCLDTGSRLHQPVTGRSNRCNEECIRNLYLQCVNWERECMRNLTKLEQASKTKLQQLYFRIRHTQDYVNALKDIKMRSNQQQTCCRDSEMSTTISFNGSIYSAWMRRIIESTTL